LLFKNLLYKFVGFFADALAGCKSVGKPVRKGLLVSKLATEVEDEMGITIILR